ncbi:MAG: acyl-CoA dehydrogenase, partial [Pseudomonadota bacterium]|nr:acyl-CoA dehydrogenase [Pseudomonadota bacterium]
MAFAAPVADIAFALRGTGLDRLIADGLYPELSPDLVDAILEEAGRFATERVAPLNRVGDGQGSILSNGSVRTPEGWGEVYRDWV